MMDYFKVLPTEERFQKLTTLQVMLLAEMRKHDLKKQEREAHPEREEFFDPEYEEWEREELERLRRKHAQSNPENTKWVEI